MLKLATGHEKGLIFGQCGPVKLFGQRGSYDELTISSIQQSLSKLIIQLPSATACISVTWALQCLVLLST